MNLERPHHKKRHRQLWLDISLKNIYYLTCYKKITDFFGIV